MTNLQAGEKHRFFGFLAKILPLFLLLCICFGSVTFAWLTSLRVSDELLTFRTGPVGYPDLAMWMFLTKEEGSSDDDGEWEEATVGISDPDDGGRKIPAAVLTETTLSAGGTGYTVSLSGLHLGTIDNLLTVKNDNTIWLRIAIDRAAFGDSCSLEAGTRVTDGTTDYPFALYDGSAAKANDGAYRLVNPDDTATDGKSRTKNFRRFWTEPPMPIRCRFWIFPISFLPTNTRRRTLRHFFILRTAARRLN